MADTKAAREFSKRWAGRGDEQQDTQKFWMDLLVNVLGVPSTSIDRYVDFERKVKGRRIDVFVEDRHFLCEQKGAAIDLDAPEVRQKRLETPFQQAMWYAQNLPYSVRPRWVMTCNFRTFRVYDLEDEHPERGMVEWPLEKLADNLHNLSFLTSEKDSRLYQEQQLSVEAGRYVTRLYDALAKQYRHLDTSADEQRSLNVLITRIIFLLYAEDADLLPSHDSFGRFCEGDPAELRRRLADLFAVVDTPVDERDEYLSEELAMMPYINGGLFHDRDVVVPQMTAEIRDVITEASDCFDWRDISGVIFGGVFEGTLNPETRRAGGMHYTSVQNIDLALDPLFLDGLRRDLAEAEGERVAAKRRLKLDRLHDRLANITFADPACGSGNFITEAYRQLRTIENRIIEDEIGEQAGSADQLAMFGAMEDPIRVTTDHFFGIEINDFAVAVAKTALWITEEQMLRRTQEIMPDYDFDFLPLRSLTNIREGNALRTEWSDVFPHDLTYLAGNPPFVGARTMSARQKEELKAVFPDARNVWDIDYCGAWYGKAADFTMQNHARCALVSTNSICQGAQVANLWSALKAKGIHIDFAHTTFRWGNETLAGEQAKVSCVIVGFSRENVTKELYVHDTPSSQERKTYPVNINAYLKDAPDVFVRDRRDPICNVPPMANGNQPRDGGNLILTDEEKGSVLSKEPSLEKWIRPFCGSDEFLKGRRRWCLWLEGATESDILDSETLSQRVRAVRDFRRASKAKTTNGYAKTPALFAQRPQKLGCDFLLVPRVSGERRVYLPIGFMEDGVIASDSAQVVPDATLYHFGVMSSQFHNAWMRTVCGRLESRYRYSKEIVYNCFVWPEPTDEQRGVIELCAKAVLDARAAHQDATLAELYDGISPMPLDPTPHDKRKYEVWAYDDLKEAHRALDAAVEAAYGVDFGGDEEKIVAHLFGLYAERTAGE